MILDMEKELQKTLHLDSNDLPYADVEDGIEFRILHARPEEGYYVTPLRVQPGSVGGLHTHSFSPGASGFMLKGAWGHGAQYLHRPGPYIFATPGVIPQLLRVPTGASLIFFGHLASDFL